MSGWYLAEQFVIFSLFDSDTINDIKAKKNTYALKTTRVVALAFIYGVECIIISNPKKEKVFTLSIEVFMCLF